MKEVSTNERSAYTGAETGRQLLTGAVWVLLGVLLPRATVYGGLNPFGIGLAAAASGPMAVLICSGVMVGYFLPGGSVMAMRYLIAAATAAGVNWSLGSFRSLREKPVYAASVAFLATAVSGAIVTATELLPSYSWLLAAAESLLAGGFAYFTRIALSVTARMPQRHMALDTREQIATVMVTAVVLMAASTLEFSGISPGNIAAIVLILMFACSGREQGGSVAGTVVGATMALSAGGSAAVAAAYAFGGLLAGMLSRFGRAACAGAFLTINVMMTATLSEALDAVIGVYEAAAASIIFMILPSAVERWLTGLFRQPMSSVSDTGRRPAVMRLNFAAKTMQEVSETVDRVSRKLATLNSPDLGTMYRGMADEQCRGCIRRDFCWEEHFSDTMASFNDMTVCLRGEGRITLGQVTGHLAGNCLRLGSIVERVNVGYREHLIRESAWRRLTDIRAVVSDQFAGMAELLIDMAEEFSADEQQDEKAAKQVADVCEKHGLTVREAVCLIDKSGRLRAEVVASDGNIRWDEEAFLSDLGAACSRRFAHPGISRAGDCIRLIISEQPQLCAAVGVAQLNCADEKLCGDAVETFYDGGGKLLAIISDGMGSGGRAAVDGAMAAGMTSRLMQSGFGADGVLRMVNSALMAKGGDESLATLDIAVIDLFTGRLENLKAGAAVSLLRSKGVVSPIGRASLPIGILRDIAFEKNTDTLTDGDILLLFSDGVTNDGLGWIEEALRDYPSGDMPTLAKKIAGMARARQKNDHEDDITVVAVRIEKAR